MSTWVRDYLYIPLGGSNGGVGMKLRNTFIIFIVSGFWHGANWTFMAWGLLNAVYFLPLLLTNKNRINLEIVALNRFLPSFKEFFQILLTFSLTVLAWVFFRADSIQHAINYLQDIFLLKKQGVNLEIENSIYYLLLFFVTSEWLGRSGQFALQKIDFLKLFWIRWLFYACIILLILFFSGAQQDFIYFQF